MMQLVVKKQIGKNLITFICDGENLFDLIHQQDNLAFPDVIACECGSQELSLRSRVTKQEGYKYVFVKCSDCGSELTFGQRRDNPNLFYLRRRDDGSLDWKDQDAWKNDEEKLPTLPPYKDV
jgi:hypothetical protein